MIKGGQRLLHPSFLNCELAAPVEWPRIHAWSLWHADQMMSLKMVKSTQPSTVC